MIPYFFVFYFWLLSASKTPIIDIPRSNQLIKEAENAYLQKNYIVALVKYRYLYHSLGIKDKQVQLNLAHCYFINKDTVQARKYYLPFTEDTNPHIQSVACQQLGVMAYKQKRFDTAVRYFKIALLAAPGNDTIRFNYELAKNLEKRDAINQTGERKKQSPVAAPNSPPPPPLENPQQPQPDIEPESRPQESDKEDRALEERLQRINLSREKAEMILDAMKNNEIQYIQQKKQVSGQKKQERYPDW